jgi:hypothetical protein
MSDRLRRLMMVVTGVALAAPRFLGAARLRRLRRPRLT